MSALLQGKYRGIWLNYVAFVDVQLIASEIIHYIAAISCSKRSISASLKLKYLASG